jgi:hypothetical protein
MGVADSRSFTYESYARMREFVRRSTYVPFRRFLGDVRRELMQRLSVVLHGTLDSYFCDDLQEGDAATVARLPAPRAYASAPVSFISASLLVDSTTFVAIN